MTVSFTSIWGLFPTVNDATLLQPLLSVIVKANVPGASVQDIIKQADTAMYSAKKQGKNIIEFF